MKKKYIIIGFLLFIFGILYLSVSYSVKDTMISSMEISQATLVVEKYLYDPKFAAFDSEMKLNPTITVEMGDKTGTFSSADLFAVNPGGNYITIGSNTETVVPFALPSATNFINALKYIYFIINDIGNTYPKQQDAVKAIGANAALLTQYSFESCQVYFIDPATITYQSSARSTVDLNRISDQAIFNIIDIANQTIHPNNTHIFEMIFSLPPKDYASILQILRAMSSPGYAGYPKNSPIASVKSYSAQQQQLNIAPLKPLPTSNPVGAPTYKSDAIPISKNPYVKPTFPPGPTSAPQPGYPTDPPMPVITIPPDALASMSKLRSSSQTTPAGGAIQSLEKSSSIVLPADISSSNSTLAPSPVVAASSSATLAPVPIPISGVTSEPVPGNSVNTAITSQPAPYI